MTNRLTRCRVAGAILFVALAGAAAAPQTGDPSAWVAEKVEACQPTAKERKFDQIGWLTDVREAKRLAKEHNRPLFLFTHDGRMATGRC
jgi:hypothetical protein